MIRTFPGTYLSVLIALAPGTAARAQFTPAIGPLLEVQTLPMSVAAADFEGDSIPDLAVANQASNTVTVYHNNGMGQFTLLTAIVLPAGTSNPTAVTAADFNGDGYPDLAIASANNGGAGGNGVITVWLNDKTGMFPAGNMKGPFPVGSGPDFVVTGNFGGSHLDLAVANSLSSNISVLLGDGTGGFAPAVSYPAGPSPTSLAVADFNSDGLMDIAVTNEQLPSPPGAQTYYTVTVLLQQAGGGFETDPLGPFIVGTNPRAVVTADFNGDYIPDLAVANYGSGNVTVLLGNGAGGFTPAPVSPPAGTMPVAMAIADFNGDRNVDLAIVDNAGYVTVLLGTGTGAFNPATGSPYTDRMGSPMSLAVSDFNEDGKPDLAVASAGNDTVSVLLNAIASAPSMVSAASFAGPVAPGSIVSILGTGFGPGGLLPPASTAAELGQASVTVTDASGVKSPALPLLFASPTQINVQLPRTTAIGAATFEINIPTGPLQTGSVMVAAVAPGLFSANGTGKGPAIGQFVEDRLAAPLMRRLPVATPKAGTPIDIFKCLPPEQNLPVIAAPNDCTPVPIDVDLSDAVLTLYGTGIRNRTSLSQVMLNVNGLTLPASYAGPAYADPPAIPSTIDQIDFPLPVTLLHAGVVNATVSIGSAVSNAVTLSFR